MQVKDVTTTTTTTHTFNHLVGDLVVRAWDKGFALPVVSGEPCGY
jgi:hypothetical protein